MTVQEMIESVEAMTGVGARERAVALVKMVPVKQRPAVLMRVTYMLLELRARRGQRLPSLPAGDDSRIPTSAPAPRSRPVPKPSGRSPARRGSRRVEAAAMAWRELLSTRVRLGDRQVEVQDMSAEQLRSMADSLYDTHERVHALAVEVERAGASCARDLSSDVLGRVARGELGS